MTPNPHTEFKHNRPAVPEIQKRSVHVRTCRDSLSMTTARTATNRTPIAFKMSTQSVRPLSSSSRRNICDAPRSALATCYCYRSHVTVLFSLTLGKDTQPKKKNARRSNARFQRYKFLKSVTIGSGLAGPLNVEIFCQLTMNSLGLRPRS